MTSYRFFHDNGSLIAAKCPTKNGTWMHAPQSGIGVTSFSHASWLKHAQHIVKIMATPSLPLDVWLSVASHGKGNFRNSCLHPVSGGNFFTWKLPSNPKKKKNTSNWEHGRSVSKSAMTLQKYLDQKTIKNIYIYIYIHNIHKSNGKNTKQKTMACHILRYYSLTCC